SPDWASLSSSSLATGGMRQMQVSEIMTTGSVAVASHATVAEVWALLRTLGVRQVPVVDERRQLLGLVSDHELSPPPRPATGDDLDDADGPQPNTPVAGLMSRGAHLFVDEDDDLGAVVDLMVENNVSVVPVVDPNVKVVGIVSYLDVLRNLQPRA